MLNLNEMYYIILYIYKVPIEENIVIHFQFNPIGPHISYYNLKIIIEIF